MPGIRFTVHLSSCTQVRTTRKFLLKSRDQLAFTGSIPCIFTQRREPLILHLETFSAPMQSLRDKNQMFFCCLDALLLAFCSSTRVPGAPEPIYFPSVSCLPKAILLHPRRLRFSQLEREETLKDTDAPETLQVGQEDKQVQEPRKADI